MEKKIIYKSEKYTGRKIGKGGFMERVGYQVVAYDAITGKRVYAFGSSPCQKIGWVASHYSSGPNKHDINRLKAMEDRAKELAENYNRRENLT